MKSSSFIAILLFPFFFFAQSDLDKVMRGGELLLGSLTILKMARSDDKKKDSKFVEAICVRNRMAQKVTFRMTGLDREANEITRELVVPKEGKECAFDVPKATYTYEFILGTGEVYKKGEYKIEDPVTFTLKDP
ncbi:hypothetical protein [Flavobacterium selenitireducens]|uniref:hypothetical protein n=1 Tax=Flavobacterium selenitireducens TaxID=2722704 RepID=UPI00168B4D05|nr:hypothetical protein [Flavobacterium selenitireducens]MBD3582218.1 hypothetical protein [Flavobacterium selenitireducens]